LFFFGDGDGQVARNALFATDFRFVWTRVSEGETEPEEYLFIDGKYLALGGAEIIDHPLKQDFATARRFGDKLNIRTKENLFTVTLPPKSGLPKSQPPKSADE
jgi:hypothetical protein